MKKLKKPPVVAVSTKTTSGIIRRGQRRPFTKATNDVVNARVEMVADYIASKPLVHDHVVRQWISKEFHIAWRFANEYIRRARVVICKRSNMTKDEAKDLIINFLLDTLKDKDKNKALRAVEQLRAIYGLDASNKNAAVSVSNTSVIAPTVIFQIPDNGRD